MQGESVTGLSAAAVCTLRMARPIIMEYQAVGVTKNDKNCYYQRQLVDFFSVSETGCFLYDCGRSHRTIGCGGEYSKSHEKQGKLRKELPFQNCVPIKISRININFQCIKYNF